MTDTNNPTNPREELARIAAVVKAKRDFVTQQFPNSAIGSMPSGLSIDDAEYLLSRPPVKAASPEREAGDPARPMLAEILDAYSAYFPLGNPWGDRARKILSEGATLSESSPWRAG